MSQNHNILLDIMQTKKLDRNQYNFETLSMPHWSYYISPNDVEYIRKVVTSIKYAGNVERKLKIIKTVMEANGFKRFAGGTNRVVYRHMEDTRFLAKIAIDKVGMSDNPNEFRNQDLLKPFCAKMFQVTPCGTIGFSERVIPIMRRGEFESIAEDVYEILDSLLDKYILEDVGTKYFMNWGISSRIGPVLLDYPYVYELDHKKLICQKDVPVNPAFPNVRETCNGFIDYDNGFNHLYCSRCNRKYEAVELKKYIERNELIIQEGGSIPMKITLRRGDEIIKVVNESDVITSTATSKPVKNTFKVSLKMGDKEFIPGVGVIDVPEKEEEVIEEAPKYNFKVSLNGTNREEETHIALKEDIKDMIDNVEFDAANIVAEDEIDIEEHINNATWNSADDIENSIQEESEMKPFYTEVDAMNDEDESTKEEEDEEEDDTGIFHNMQEVIDDPTELRDAINNALSMGRAYSGNPTPVNRRDGPIKVTIDNINAHSNFIQPEGRSRGSE